MLFIYLLPKGQQVTVLVYKAEYPRHDELNLHVGFIKICRARVNICQWLNQQGRLRSLDVQWRILKMFSHSQKKITKCYQRYCDVK